jgi:hypothetical protein
MSASGFEIAGVHISLGTRDYALSISQPQLPLSSGSTQPQFRASPALSRTSSSPRQKQPVITLPSPCPAKPYACRFMALVSSCRVVLSQAVSAAAFVPGEDSGLLAVAEDTGVLFALAIAALQLHTASN